MAEVDTRDHCDGDRRRRSPLAIQGGAFGILACGERRLLERGEPEVYETIERLVFTTAFEYCRENQVRTARELGISRNVLRTQLKRFGLIREAAEAGSRGVISVLRSPPSGLAEPASRCD